MDLNRKNMQKLALLIAGTVLLLVGLQNVQKVGVVLGKLFGLVMPFILGGCIAFILNVPMAFIERHLFRKRKDCKYKRPICLVLALVFVVGLMVVAGVLIVPQLGRSMRMLSAAFPQFYVEAQQWLSEIGQKIPALSTIVGDAQVNWSQMDWGRLSKTVISFLNGTGDLLGSTFSMATSIVGGFVTFFLGTFFAIYVLAQKEKLGSQIKKLLYATLPEPPVDSFLSVCALAQRTFSNFITGQCTEAFILGVMFFISMWLLRFPYALLTGVIISLTALIPIFGAFIGCAFGAFFILIESPIQALWFIVLFLIIQQIEGNFIYPHVVGHSVGLPSIWVLVAVSVGGASMGVVGMLVFIPLFSVLYTLLRGYINKQLALRAVSPEKWEGKVAPPPEDKPPQSRTKKR